MIDSQLANGTTADGFKWCIEESLGGLVNILQFNLTRTGHTVLSKAPNNPHPQHYYDIRLSHISTLFWQYPYIQRATDHIYCGKLEANKSYRPTLHKLNIFLHFPKKY